MQFVRLRDKVAVVVGGASGIGEAISLKFAEEGANVAVVDVNSPLAEVVRGKAKAMGRDALAVATDIRDYEQVTKMTETVIGKFGKIDVLVNSAGISEFGSIEQITIDSWKRIIDVNLTGLFYCCLTVGRKMMEKKKGKIINISSLAGIIGVPGNPHYVASKHGVVGLTKALAVDLAGYNINVNCICPSTTLTPMLEKSVSAEFMKSQIERIPLSRLAKPEDQANAALFLASDESDYITGLIMNVDGGLFASLRKSHYGAVR